MGNKFASTGPSCADTVNTVADKIRIPKRMRRTSIPLDESRPGSIHPLLRGHARPKAKNTRGTEGEVQVRQVPLQTPVGRGRLRNTPPASNRGEEQQQAEKKQHPGKTCERLTPCR